MSKFIIFVLVVSGLAGWWFVSSKVPNTINAIRTCSSDVDTCLRNKPVNWSASITSKKVLVGDVIYNFSAFTQQQLITVAKQGNPETTLFGCSGDNNLYVSNEVGKHCKQVVVISVPFNYTTQ